LATLTTQTITRAGNVVTPVSAAGGGDAMACGSGMMLEVVNAGGSPITVTLAVPAARTYEPNVAITSPAVSVVNGTTRWFGPIDAGTFQDPTTGLCTITYSGVTSVTVAAVQLTQP
jgi:hypothetical protein